MISLQKSTVGSTRTVKAHISQVLKCVGSQHVLYEPLERWNATCFHCEGVHGHVVRIDKAHISEHVNCDGAQSVMDELL